MRKLPRVKPWIIREDEQPDVSPTGEYLQTPAAAGRLPAVQHVHQLHALLRRLPGLRARPRVHRAGRHRARAALQPRLARPGVGSGSTCSSSTRASGAAPSSASARGSAPRTSIPRGHPALQAEGGAADAEGLPAPAGARDDSRDDAATDRLLPAPSHARSGGGPRKRTYFVFVLRELSSIFVAWFVVYLLLLRLRRGQGEAAYQRFLDWAAAPWVIALNVVALALRAAAHGHLVQPHPAGDGGAGGGPDGAGVPHHRRAVHRPGRGLGFVLWLVTR